VTNFARTRQGCVNTLLHAPHRMMFPAHRKTSPAHYSKAQQLILIVDK
jgi:hypothetical protein